MKVKKRKKPKMCDPNVCDDCLYIGEGDFVCSQHIQEPDRALVIDEWVPTENYLQCQGNIASQGGEACETNPV